MMRVDVLTLFPSMLEGVLQHSILGRAQEQGQLQIVTHQLRDYALDKHRIVDDRPFGGGPGMVLKCEPLVRAIESIQAMCETPAHVVYLTPQGNVLRQSIAQELATKHQRLLLISGHYEGIDERVREGGWIHQEISIGDYVLTNGTLPAMVLIDTVARLLPGVLGNEESALTESFTGGLIEGPQYTRPEEYQGMGVPEILLSGNHAAIAQWRHEKAKERTQALRPDLLTAQLQTV